MGPCILVLLAQRRPRGVQNRVVGITYGSTQEPALKQRSSGLQPLLSLGHELGRPRTHGSPKMTILSRSSSCMKNESMARRFSSQAGSHVCGT